MSPTFYRYKNIRIYVNSREEKRKHVHVQLPDGEAKIWIEPEVEIAKNYGIESKVLNEILDLVKEKKDEFEKLWNKHFRI